MVSTETTVSTALAEKAIVAPRRAYFPALNGVRAIAALMVIVFHFFQAHGQDSRFFIGQTGVDLFFVLSGFLITLILVEARGEAHAFSHFYMRRALRIFPLYYGYLIGSILFGLLPAWQYWIYLQNFALASGKLIGPPEHFWSLAVEEHFYFLWPLIALKAPRRVLPAIAVLLFSIAVVARFVMASRGLDVFYPTECRLDGLALGALLALAQSAGLMKKVAAYCWPVAGIALAATALMIHRYGGQHAAVFQAAKPLLFSIFYAAFIGIVLQAHLPALNRVLASRFLGMIGLVSYGLYVYHPCIIRLVLRFGISNWLLQFAVVAVLTFVTSWLSWTLFEKRFLVLKARFS